MRVIVGKVGFVIMAVGSFVFSVNVVMGVGVAVFVGVSHAAMTMFVRVQMGMLMIVLQRNGILDQQYCGDDHEN